MAANSAASAPNVPITSVRSALARLGLLHDVGRLVFFAESPDLLEELDEEQWDSPAELVAAERAICGLDHGTVGQLACDHWGLPHRIGALAQRHHLPIDSVSDEWSVQLLELLTFAYADVLCERLGIA